VRIDMNALVNTIIGEANDLDAKGKDPN
jgi:hypothetical protein